MEIFSNIPSLLLFVFVFLLMISVLVAAHEYGHYLFARMFGMGVEEFAVGFGKPVVWTWMRKSYRVKDELVDGAEEVETTDFTVRPLPIGGFVRIKGMIPEEDGSEVHVPGGFYNKAPWKRFLTLLAGPAFSVLAGILILVPLYSTVGIERRVNEPVVGGLIEDSPAAKAGLKPGDRIISVNGVNVNSMYDSISQVRDSADTALPFVYEQDGVRKNAVITPKLAENDSPVLDANLEPTGEWKRQALIGITFSSETKLVKLSLGDALVSAVNEPVRAVRSIIGLAKAPKNFDKTVAGPATMVVATNEAFKQGISKILVIAALISISVGVFNLLPFAPLDGGQMLVAVVEMIRGGRRLSIQMQTAINAVGLTLILTLVLGAWVVDFKRFLPEKPAVTKPAK